MRRKQTVGIVFAFTIAYVVAVGIVGCSKKGGDGPAGPQGPPGPPGPSNVIIMGEVRLDSTTANTGVALVWVSNAPSVPTVKVNNSTIPLSSIVGSAYEFSLEKLAISAGNTADLEVSFSRTDGSTGTAQASVTLPGPFTMTNPAYTPYWIPRGSGFTARWTPSAGVTRYILEFQWELWYFDFGMYYQRFEKSRVMLIPDTNFTLPATDFWPVDVNSVDIGLGRIYVAAIAGPVTEGQEGNVTGDGSGFFVGSTPGKESDLEHYGGP